MGKEYYFEDKGYTKEEFLALAEAHKKDGINTAVVTVAEGLKKKKPPARKAAAKKEPEKKTE